MNLKRQYKSFDFILVLLVCIISIMGIIAIGSATHIDVSEDKSLYFTQIGWFAISLVLMLVASFIDYNFLGNFYMLAYIFIVGLLALVPILGKNINGATRWIDIFGVSIQPSEFSKIIVIFCLAKFIEKNKDNINHFFTLMLIAAYGLFPVALVFLQSSLSTSLVLVFIVIISLFVGGVNFKYIFAAFSIAAVAITIVLTDVATNDAKIVSTFLQGYQIERIEALIWPEQYKDTTYYQTLMSINAIGSGQMWGKGLYQSEVNELNYLPLAYNDFIFSIIGEEFGFVGCMVILGLEVLIIIRCIWIGRKAVDLFGTLIASGVAGMIAFQTFVHISVTTGILPNTGVTLPFVSYGGSSLLSTIISIGLVLNVGMTKQKSLFEGV